MKRKAALVLVLGGLCAVASTSRAIDLIASFDIPILGLTATPDPASPVIPKNTESGVRIVLHAGDRTLTLAEAATYLGAGFEVRGTLAGPGIDKPITVPQLGPSDPPPDDPLLLRLPPLPLAGDYQLSNVRILRDGKPLLDVNPSQIPVKVIDQVLITSVKTRTLTLEEIQAKGIVLDSSSYVGFDFQLGIATESQSVSFTQTVIFDRQGVPVPQAIEPPDAPPRSGVNVTGDLPEPLIIPSLLTIDQDKMDIPDIEKALRGPSGEPIRIPSVLVIPGNVGYLKQHFSAQLFVANGTPVGSGLNVRDVTGTVHLPAGADAAPGTADDPLSLPPTVRGPQAPTLPVRHTGPDGIPDTADDVSVLRPSEQGQAEFLIRGDKEGFHNLDFDINAILDGLAIGPVPIKGSAKGGVLVRNPFFNMTFTIPSVVRKGETFSIFSTITNIGQSLANDVSVTLDASRTSGATLVGEPTQRIPTLRPRDARTLEFKFVSQRTGQTFATYLNLDTSQGGGNLKFSLGVGERGVALSPDTLVLPTAVDALPATVVDAAMRVLGQAWSISSAPTGTLPPDVIRVSRSVATQKALALSEAGLRASLGQPTRDAVRDLAFDFWGGTPLDAGFDQLLRQTHAGQDLARAIGAELAAPLASAGGVLPFGRAIDDVAISGADYIGIAVGNGSEAAPVTVKLLDPGGGETAQLTSVGELSRADIPGMVWLPFGPTATEPLYGILTAPAAPVYTLQLTGTGSGALDLAVTQPAGDGSFARGTVSGLAISAGSQARLVIDRRTPDTLVVQRDADGDGEFESSQPLATERIVSPGPKLLSATLVGPETVDGASPFGFQVAALFDRVLDAASAAAPGNYTMPKNAVQSAKAQLSGRIVFASLNQPEGPYVPTTLSATGIRDRRGAVGPSLAVPLASKLEDPGAVVSGRVLGADGTPVTAGIVTYQNNALWWCPDDPDPESTHAGFAAVPLDAQGRYEFRFVRQDKCGFPWAILVKDPTTGSLRQGTGFVRAAGELIVLDFALNGQGTVTGVVTNVAGTPVPGAGVAVVSQTDPQVGGVATTDGDGRYTVYGITVGQVSVRAAKGTGVGQNSGNIPRAGATATVNVTLDSGAGSVEGRVLAEEGAVTSPLAGLQVVLETSGTAVGVTQTDALGRYRFDDVPAGAFKVKAAMNTRDRGETSRVMAAGDALINVDVVIFVPSADGTTPPGNLGYGTLRGFVHNADGTAAPGTIVSTDQRGVLSEESGAFEIPGVQVQPGVPRMVVAQSRDGLRSGTAAATLNVAGQVVDGITIVLSGVGSAEFTVLGPTGAPVAGQDVGILDRCEAECGCKPLKTGADGKVRFDGLPLGTVTVRAVRGGVGFVDVVTGSAAITRNNEVATATLRFAGSGVVKGNVRDPNNQPAFGADVTLQSLVFDPTYCALVNGISQRVRTNTSGDYRFVGVNVGPVTVTASQIFLPNPTARSGALTDVNQELTLDLALNNGVSTIAGELSGTVYLPDGTTPAGAGIEITANGALPDVVVSTNAAGHYQFAKIFPEGNYTLTARDPITGGLARTTVYLRAAKDATQDMRLLGRGTVRVSVVDAADVPVNAAFVRLTESSFPNRLFEGAVDAAHQGVVTFENVFEGPLAAEASDSFARGGRVSSVLTGPGAVLDMKVRLSMTGRVTGRFLAADGETPVPFGAVSLTAGGRVLGQTTTKGAGPDAGRFAFEFVPAGPVRVDAQDPATARTGFAVGTITSQGQVVDLIVRSQGLGTVTGFVTSNGTPQAGAEVSLVVGGFRANTVSDSTGRYLITGVPEGQVVATAHLGAEFLSGSAVANLVGDGTTLTLNVPLRGSGKVTGRVVKADGVTASRPASVSINVGGTGGGAFSTVTDADGRFTFDRVPAGLASFSADVLGSIDRGALTTEVAAAGTTEVTIRLHGVGSLRVNAQDSLGQPTRGTIVVSGTGDIPYTLSTAVGDSGTFLFPEVLAGPFSVSLTVQTPTFALYGSASGAVLSEQQATIAVRVQPTGEVKGRVLRANGTTPAPGAEVTLQLLPNRGSLVLYATGDGTFSVRGVPLGAITLRVRDAFSDGAALVEDNSLASNGQIVDVGDVVLDDTPVTVVAFSPPDGAVQIPTTQPITVTFSDRLLSAAGITVSNGTTSLGSGATLSADQKTVTLTGQWTDSREITVTATTAVTDVFGRRLAQPVSSRFRTVDLSAPAVVALAPGNGAIEVDATASITVTFGEELDPGANVAGVVALARGGQSVQGASARTSANTVTFTPAFPLVGDSTYTVTVNGAVDLAGNVQTQPFSSTFKTHDTQPPVLALTQPAPGTWTNNNRPTIAVSLTDSLSGIDATTGALAVDGAAVVPVRSTSALSYTPASPLADGGHTVEASVKDRAGNPGTVADEVSVDTVLPGPAAITGIVSGAVLSGTVPFGATATDARSGVREIQIFSDGTKITALTAPPAPPFQGQLAAQSLSEGRHTLTARALDQAGNLGPAGGTVEVTVDNQPLTVTITEPPSGKPVREALTVKATVSEPVQRVVFSAGAVTFTDDIAPYEATLDVSGLPIGPATVTAIATGLLGETATASRGFEIDREAPPAPVAAEICAEPPDLGRSLVHGNANAVEAGATVNATIGAASASTLARSDGGFELILPAAPGDTVTLFAVDAAGNVSPTTTISVRTTTCLPPVQATLTYHGDLVDMVGPGLAARSPDGANDAVFEITFALGTGITRQIAFVDLKGPATRSTRIDAGSILGVSGADLGAPLLNKADGTVDATLVDHPITKNVSLLLYASSAGFIQAGPTYTATVVFTNGGRFIGSVPLQSLPTQEVTSAAFSMLNQSLPPDLETPPVATGEVASPPVSVDNQSLPPFDPGVPVATGEAASLPFSVANQSLPFDVTDPAIGLGVPEVASLSFSVANQSLPPYGVDQQPPPEVVSLAASFNNQSLPFAASDLAAITEVASLSFSVNNDPNLVTRVGSQYNPGVSCAAILSQGGSVGDGTYWVKDSSGGAFQIGCDMITRGGGWTQLTGAYADVVSTGGSSSLKEYLYAFGGRWYVSPKTTLPWSWTTGQELTGTYEYATAADAGASSFTCAGSPEKPPFGIGCSGGPGGTQKVLPWLAADAAGGTCTLCQDLPNAFGGSACQAGVKVMVRTVPASAGDGGTDAGTNVDSGARDARDGGAGCLTPPAGIVAWWPGDGNAADVVGGNNGTVESGTSFAAGKVGQAFTFSGMNGTGGVNLGNVPALDFDATSSFTIEAWVNVAGPTAQDGQMIVALNYECSQTLQALAIQATTGKAFFTVRDANAVSVSVTSPGPLSPNTFHHLVGVRNATGSGKTATLYIDGTQVATAADPSTGPLARNTADLIGRRFVCGDTGTFNGLIDEVTVYQRALTAIEIQQIFGAGSAGKCK